MLEQGHLANRHHHPRVARRRVRAVGVRKPQPTRLGDVHLVLQRQDPCRLALEIKHGAARHIHYEQLGTTASLPITVQAVWYDSVRGHEANLAPVPTWTDANTLVAEADSVMRIKVGPFNENYVGADLELRIFKVLGY